MSELPSRFQIAGALVLGALGGGALFGAAESSRVVTGSSLLLSGGGVVALVAAGTASVALSSAFAALPLVALPPRPLGRSRWLGFLVGLAAPVAAAMGVWWFTDPPPFVDPLPLQGNPLAFAGALAVLAGGVLVAYQGARGARATAATALALAVAAGVWVAAGVRSTRPATQALPAGAPNVLVVTLDTTRADRFGAYGNAEADTRHFDGVGRDGALFTDAMAVAPVTGPSHASMFSGAGPWDHGVLLNGVPLPERPLLAEVLRAHGWATGGFVSAYVLDGDLGFRRGFDVYDDDFGWLKGGEDLLVARVLAMVRRAADPDEVLERRGGDTVDAALDWLAVQDGRPWYLWVHLFDPHGPYAPPPPWDTRYYQGDPTDPANTSMKGVKNVAAYLTKSLQGITDVDYVLAQYDGEVGYADTQVGRLLTTVAERGEAQDTLVLVIGDHGESLGENDVWFNHGDDVYETSVHVPFALRWPARVPAGTQVTSPFEGSDLAPTVLDLVGIRPPETMTGRSAAAQFTTPGGRSSARSVCFDREANRSERAAGRITKPQYRMASTRSQDARYVLQELGGAASYYELASDPLGVRDVRDAAAADPARAAEMTALDAQARALFESDATARSGAAEISDAERARLEALGYLSQ
jgi:arylsulfatase A-like enzyme